jgi:hypothetical protein
MVMIAAPDQTGPLYFADCALLGMGDSLRHCCPGPRRGVPALLHQEILRRSNCRARIGPPQIGTIPSCRFWSDL